MSNEADRFKTTFVWQNVDEALGIEIVNFWKQYGALPSTEFALKRLPEVAMLVYDEQEQIVAISSVQPRHIPQLDHRFYTFRCFVAPDCRRFLLAARLICEVYDAFNKRFENGANPDVIGMVAEVENPALNREHNHAVWPHSGFVFVGYNQAGQHVRVRFFDGAHVKSRI
jgi:hypothetical protein